MAGAVGRRLERERLGSGGREANPSKPVQIFPHQAAALPSRFAITPTHPIPSHYSPPLPSTSNADRPASQGKVSAWPWTIDLDVPALLPPELNRSRPRAFRPAARPPSLLLSLKTRNLLSTLAEPHSTQRPLSSTKTLLSLDDSARPTGYHYVEFVLSGSPCIPPPPGH